MNKTSRATRLIFLVFGIGISSWAPMVPFAKSRLGLNDAELGLALLIFGLGAIVTMPLSAWFVHRLGSRLVALVSGICTLTIIPFLTIAPTLTLLSFTLLMFGAATSAVNISINAQAVFVENQAKKRLMSGFHCLFSIGGLLGVGLVGFLLELGWPLVYCGLMVSAVMGVIFVTQYNKLLIEDRSTPSKKLPFKFPERGALIVGLFCFAAFMAEGSMLDWSAEFLRTSLKYPASHAGVGYAIFSIAMAFGRLIGDQTIARFGRNTVFQWGGLLAACGFITLITAPLPYLELLGFLFVGLGCSNIVPILFSASGKFPRTPPHVALSVITSFGYSGLLVGPALIGFLANSLTLSFALTGIAALIALAALFGPFFLQNDSIQENVQPLA